MRLRRCSFQEWWQGWQFPAEAQRVFPLQTSKFAQVVFEAAALALPPLLHLSIGSPGGREYGFAALELAVEEMPAQTEGK